MYFKTASLSSLLILNFGFAYSSNVEYARDVIGNDLKDIFNRSYTPFCDLTKDLCDINCCSDKDCGPDDVKIFQCVDTNHIENPFIFDSNYCYNQLPSHLNNVNPIFCYEYENSPYLGYFFNEDEIIINKKDIDTIKIYRKPKTHKFKNPEPEIQDLSYKYGKPILALSKNKQESVLFATGEILGKGYCSDTIPVRYLINRNSKCLTKITEKTCQSYKFNINSYLKGDILNVLSGLDKKPVIITLKYKCFNNITKYLFLNKLKLNTQIKYDSCKESPAFYNGSTGFCENVILKMDYDFKWNFTNIKELVITFVLTNVPVSPSLFINTKPAEENNIYLIQSYSINFREEHKKYTLSGYHLNEPILVYNVSFEKNCSGCKNESSKEKTKIWTKDNSFKESFFDMKAPLSEFKSFGGNCSEEKTLFGYNTIRTCFFDHTQCHELRKTINRMVDKYSYFDAVSDGLGSAVPHIRENNMEIRLEENSSECYIPVGIQFRILYSTYGNKFPRYKIVGFHSSITNGKCTEKCALTWSVYFSEIQPKSLQSRWMDHMTSRIGSSYSWINIFSTDLHTDGRIDQFGTVTFKLCVLASIILILLRLDY